MTELWIYSTPKPNMLENIFVGFVCSNEHYQALTEWQIENSHLVKSESQCPVCGETTVPCSGFVRGGKLEPEEYRGSDFVHMTDGRTGIVLGCMNVEARELLDALVARFEKVHEKSIHDVDGYTALYDAVRWSGLIRPSGKIPK